MNLPSVSVGYESPEPPSKSKSSLHFTNLPDGQQWGEGMTFYMICIWFQDPNIHNNSIHESRVFFL